MIKLIIAAILLSPAVAFADTFFNSSEPGCDGSDPNVLWCDDFERGSWAATLADPANPANAGWNMTPYGAVWPDAAGTNWGRCGGKGAGGTNCAADSGQPNPSGQGQHDAMGDHGFFKNQTVSEIYFRYYIQPSADRQYSGNEKMLTFNPFLGSGGIILGCMGAPNATDLGMAPVYEQNIYNNPFRYQNQNCVGGTHVRNDPGNGSLYYPTAQLEPICNNPFVPGPFSTPHWFYVEAHVKLNTPGQANGQWQLWVNDCGTSGICSGTPTLRSSYGVPSDNTAGIQYVFPNNVCPGTGNSPCLIGAIWMENWQNPSMPGSDRYDQIKVSKVGPIGFMKIGQTAAGSIPARPSGLALK